MEINVWRKVAIAVQSALAAAKTITAITKANPAVVTSVAHGYVDTDILLLKVEGMVQADYLVVRVDDKTDDTFELEGVDSSTWGTFTSGTAEKLTLGNTASSFIDMSWAGGDRSGIGVTTIHNEQDFEVNGNRSPLIATLNALWRLADAALVALSSHDAAGTICCVGVTFDSGAKVYFAASPSARLTPSGSAGQVVTTPVTLRVRGGLTMFAS